jgi:RTX calcium-binding nonapeptide repeat (4 copies)
MHKSFTPLFLGLSLLVPASAAASPITIKTQGSAAEQQVIVDARGTQASDGGTGGFYSFVRYNQAPADGVGPDIQGIQIAIKSSNSSLQVQTEGSCYQTVVSIWDGSNQGTSSERTVYRCPLEDDPNDTVEEETPYGPQSRAVQPWETTSLVFLGSVNNDSVHNLTAAYYARATSGPNAYKLKNADGAGHYDYYYAEPMPARSLPMEARMYAGHDYVYDGSGASEIFGGDGVDYILGSGLQGEEVDFNNKNRGSSQTTLPPVDGDLISSGGGSVPGSLDVVEGGAGNDTLYTGAGGAYLSPKAGADTIYDGSDRDYMDLSQEGRSRLNNPDYTEPATPDVTADAVYCEAVGNPNDENEASDNVYVGVDAALDTRQTDGCEPEPADTWEAVPTPPTPTPTPTPVSPEPTPAPPVLEPIGPPTQVAPPYVPPVSAPKPIVLNPIAQPGQAKANNITINIAYSDKGKLSSTSSKKLKQASTALKAASTKNRLVTLYYSGSRSKSDAEKAFAEIKKVTKASFKLKLVKGSKTSKVTYTQYI